MRRKCNKPEVIHFAEKFKKPELRVITNGIDVSHKTSKGLATLWELPKYDQNPGKPLECDVAQA